MSLYTKIIDRQKLQESWKKVRSNKPAAGVDEVTYEEYERHEKENLKQLYMELAEHRYESMPVRMVTIYKEEKARQIGLFTMRDKVVQQSVASELLRIYDGKMSDSTYAYRPGKSALSAIQMLEEKLKNPDAQWMLKTDIRHFFDNIPLQKLYHVLQKNIREDDVMRLIQECCETMELQKDGTLRKKECGLYQGSSVAPVLSNIYLMEFDADIREQSGTYLRYSDDILILGKTEEEMEEVRKSMEIRLQILGLELNQGKTEIKPAEEGVVFLGYHLSKKGRTVPAHAEKNLSGKLEDIWFDVRLRLEDKLKKGAEILGGWEQYYRDERPIGSIQEYAVVVYMTRYKSDDITDKVKQQRTRFENIYKEICEYLVSVWKESQDWELMLLEYEQLFGIYEQNSRIEEKDILLLCDIYQRLLQQETEEMWEELMQQYADISAYSKAAQIMERITEMKSGLDQAQSDRTQMIQNTLEENEEEDRGRNSSEKNLLTSPAFLQQYLKTFTGREDTYGREELNEGKRRCVEQVPEPLTEEVLKSHFTGKCTVSTYIQRNNHTVKYLVIDVDVSKRVLLKRDEIQSLRQYMPKAAEAAQKVLKVLKRLGLKGYLEDSGYRGYHVWVFFTEWIPVRYVTMLEDIIENELGQTDTGQGDSAENRMDITVEYFPNKSKMRNGSFGQAIKLPLGFHVRTGRRSRLLSDDLTPVSADEEYLKDIAKFSLQAVKKIIGYRSGTAGREKETKEVDRDLQGFGDLPEEVRVVLENCNLMRYLCQKARTTGYLSHFERLSVLYVFGHLGEEGRAFVHTVMEFTLNYQYHVTEKFIRKIPQKPISCLKLRDQYKQITAEYGCSCDFKRTKNCYPSPVLHAIKSGGDIAQDITVPTSRTLSKEKEQKVVEEINIHKKVQELAGRIIEMKKQRRGVDKAIQKAENELEKIYDQAEVDCLEVEMGLLVRRKTDAGYEWLIEI